MANQDNVIDVDVVDAIDLEEWGSVESQFDQSLTDCTTTRQPE